MFLHPLMLFAMAGVAAPILIHLLNRRRIERINWAAMRFLEAAIRRNRRRLNLEDLLLLLLRCAILLFVALAMARPAVHSPIAQIFGQAHVAAAIVLDSSESMALTDGATSRYDVAKDLAKQVIDSLPSRSELAIYAASDISQPLIAEPTHDMFLARQTIDGAMRTDRPTNLLPAITQAIDVLKASASDRRELYIITDGQALGLKQLTDIRKLLADNKQTVHTTFLLDGVVEEHNMAVTSFAIAPAQWVVADQPLRFDVQVTNFGKSVAKDVRLTLNIDTSAPTEEAQIDEIPPGKSRSTSLLGRFRQAGYHTVTAQLPHDRLPTDDQRTVALHIEKTIPILLVTSDSDPDSRDSATYYLRQALQPVPIEARGTFFITTRTITPAQLEDTRLADYSGVILADVDRVTAAEADALSQYVSGGGGMVVFPGPLTRADSYNAQLLERAKLLPAQLDAVQGDLPDNAAADSGKMPSFVTFQSGGYTHPIVSLWADPAAGTLSSARFFRRFSLTPLQTSTAAQVQTVLSYSDGKPAMLTRRVGRGEVVLFASSANTAWNDLPVRPAFLPLLYRTLGQLAQRKEADLTLRVGDPFQYPLSAEMLNRDATITPPVPATRDERKVDLLGDEPMLVYRATDLAGAYTVTIPGDSPLELKFAAQPDPSESNLTLASDLQTERLAEVARVMKVDTGAKLTSMLQQERVGRELWLPLALTALVLAVTETLLADRFSRPK
jgi:hypothetical protein